MNTDTLTLKQFALKGTVLRRALARKPGYATAYYVETVNKESLYDFAEALADYGFIDAVYLTGAETLKRGNIKAICLFSENEKIICLFQNNKLFLLRVKQIKKTYMTTGTITIRGSVYQGAQRYAKEHNVSLDTFVESILVLAMQVKKSKKILTAEMPAWNILKRSTENDEGFH